MPQDHKIDMDSCNARCYCCVMPRYTLALDEDVYTRVKIAAAADDRSIGSMLRRLIVEALELRKEKENT